MMYRQISRSPYVFYEKMNQFHEGKMVEICEEIIKTNEEIILNK